jgi:hypothetical protein
LIVVSLGVEPFDDEESAVDNVKDDVELDEIALFDDGEDSDGDTEDDGDDDDDDDDNDDVDVAATLVLAGVEVNVSVSGGNENRSAGGCNASMCAFSDKNAVCCSAVNICQTKSNELQECTSYSTVKNNNTNATNSLNLQVN